MTIHTYMQRLCRHIRILWCLHVHKYMHIYTEPVWIYININTLAPTCTTSIEYVHLRREAFIGPQKDDSEFKHHIYTQTSENLVRKKQNDFKIKSFFGTMMQQEGQRFFFRKGRTWSTKGLDLNFVKNSWWKNFHNYLREYSIIQRKSFNYYSRK